MKDLSLGKTQFNLRDDKRIKKGRRRRKTKIESEIPKPNPFGEKGSAAPLSSMEFINGIGYSHSRLLSF